MASSRGGGGRACAAPGCDRPAVARGLCMRHYKRARAGRPLTDPPVGSPDGHGRYGILDTDGQRCLCHECGRWYRRLGAHVERAHGRSARDYKRAHGLPLSRGLVAEEERRPMSERARSRVGGAGWERLEEARDPAAAARARDEAARDAVSAAARRRDTTGSLPAWEPRVITCAVCGAAYCPLPGTGRGRRTCSAACAAEASAAAAARGRATQRARARRGPDKKEDGA